MMAKINLDDLTKWIGRHETAHDTISAGLIDRFEKTLGLEPDHRHEAPLGLHWCLAPPAVTAHNIGTDGHPKKGGFLPPVPLTYRMWAAGTLEFIAPLPSSGLIERRSEILSLTLKEGRTGALIFLELGHRYSHAGKLCLNETQTIVYKGENASGAAQKPEPLAWLKEQQIEPDPVLLFRYSALTFNGHRIHYDYPYARTVENYPDIVVHGPMIATLLTHLAAQTEAQSGKGRRLRHFRFRGISPAFCNRPLHLKAAASQTGLTLRALGEDGRLIMQAEAAFDGPPA